MARPRLRATLVVAALLAGATPLVANATAPHLTCAPKPVGRWEVITIAPFRPISGLSASNTDTVTAYSLDRQAPQNVVATNGSSIQVSRSHGCAWSTSFELDPALSGSQTFVGSNATIVSVAVLGRRVMAAVTEGTGAASRPHILTSSSGSAGTWTTSDNGLPAQGSARLLRAAADGRTAYLTISPTATGGSDGGATTGILPLPGGGGTGTPTGFLYRTTDGGANWTLQTGAGDLPGGGTGFSQLEIDSSNTNSLYGIVGGRLLSSRDGGGTFTAAAGSGYTAVTAAGAQEVLAFGPNGGVHSFNGGTSYSTFPAPSGVTGAAVRSGHSGVVVEVGGKLTELEPNGGARTALPAPSRARAGSLIGDRSAQSSIHGLTGHSLLRLIDPPAAGVTIPPLAIGDITVPPPVPGVVSPRARNVSLPVGNTAVEDFTLDLPKNPTPLDLFFLVDVSSSMGDYIADLQKNIRGIVAALKAAKVNLKVGVGTVGTGPVRGERAYPDTYAFPPQTNPSNPTGPPVIKQYVKPTLYNRIRPIGDTGPSLTEAIDALRLETAPPGYSNSEGQLLALKNLANGLGTTSELDDQAGLSRITAIPPGLNAGFRGQADVRRVVVLATNEYFQAPYGGGPDKQDVAAGSTPSDPQLNFQPTIDILNRNRIGVIGLTAGVIDAQPDLQKLAKGTRMLAPAGGIACDGAQVLAQGDPLVCNNAENFSSVITRVLGTLVDRQTVQAVPHTRTPVLGTIDGSNLRQLDVKQPNRVSFQVRVSCIDVKPGTYPQDVDLILRQTIVGRARVNVTCVKANTIVRPRPVTVPDTPVVPPNNPVPNPPPPPAPAPPAAQPQAQPQVQTQVQIQPLTAGAIQEQQELQLALALNGTLKDDDPVFNGGQQMAMVDRRKREEVQALGVLAFAILTCAGVGLAGLRARPEIRTRRAR